MDPVRDPIPRRRALRIMGGGVLAAGAGIALVVEACGPAATPVAAVWVTLDVDPATITSGVPTEVPLTFTPVGGGSAVAASTWLVKAEDGSFVAYDPRCTHAECAYRWVSQESRFDCLCHKGAFGIDGAVLFGPPPRPLDRFPTQVADGKLEVQVPGDLSTPRPAA
jgi:Rieske Fe-S protein